jgi:hypothetical protein
MCLDFPLESPGMQACPPGPLTTTGMQVMIGLVPDKSVHGALPPPYQYYRGAYRGLHGPRGGLAGAYRGLEGPSRGLEGPTWA